MWQFYVCVIKISLRLQAIILLHKYYIGDEVNDKVYKTDGSAQQTVWVIGPLNTQGEAARHYPKEHITGMFIHV